MLKYLPLALLAVLATGQAKAQIITFQVSGTVTSMQFEADDDTPAIAAPDYPISIGDPFTFTETLQLAVQPVGSDDAYSFVDISGSTVITIGNLEFDINDAEAGTDVNSLVLSTTGTNPSGGTIASGIYLSVSGSLPSPPTLDSLRALTPNLSSTTGNIQFAVDGYGKTTFGMRITSYSISPSLEGLDEESVPEPSTSALLLLGALAIGCGVRMKTQFRQR